MFPVHLVSFCVCTCDHLEAHIQTHYLICFPHIIPQISFSDLFFCSLFFFLLLFHAPSSTPCYYLSLLACIFFYHVIIFLFLILSPPCSSHHIPFFPQSLIHGSIIHLFFTYSFNVPFFIFSGEAHFPPPSLSLSLARAINVNDCAILRRVKDMRRLSKRSIDDI